MKFQAHQRNLLQCDSRQSVLSRGAGGRVAYGCFGWGALSAGPQPAFNGVLRELGGGYLLGNGYRMYLPALRRFCSPDSLSPFGEGGINAYAYCSGDPVSAIDPSGHAPTRLAISLGAQADEVTRMLRPPTRNPVSHLPTIAESSSLAQLNQVGTWKPMRDRYNQLSKEISSSAPGQPVAKSVIDELNVIKADLMEMFPGYGIESGLALGDAQRLSHQVKGFLGHSEFSRNVLIKELDRAMPLFTPATAEKFLSNTPSGAMQSLRSLP